MRLYNALSRQIEEVKPADGRTVKIYSCGPTVYRYAHIGNMRTFMLGDLIRRALRFEGQDVVQVMNITDVGHMTDDVSPESRDRMDIAVADEGLSPGEIADKYTAAFLEDVDALNIERADAYPKATDHIPEMVQLIGRLMDKSLAYQVEGNVYFDVHAFPSYGRLSGNTLEALRAGHRQELEVDPNKRHPEDFALWKRGGGGRLMKWPSPWGDGFPGWHIECSAMSMKYLGERFDIHTGGNDLKFPHHEDEIAQSDGATGHQVVSIWVYGGFLQQSGQKMAKSARNITRVTELADAGLDPLAFRLLCFGARYRSETDFSWEALEGANQRLRRVRRLMARAGSQTQFEQAAEDLLCYAGLKVEGREIERVAEEVGRRAEQWLSDQQEQLLQTGAVLSPTLDPQANFYVSFDGTGVPVRKNELVGRRGKQADGSARTREAKLGCVFTQVELDKEGYPQRDPDSTTYVGAIESSTLWLAHVRRGPAPRIEPSQAGHRADRRSALQSHHRPNPFPRGRAYRGSVPRL